jgi:hypothetical protein
MPPPSWSRSPEARASEPDRKTKVWIRWLALRCALPLEHVATVLALDLAAVDACINRTTCSGPVPGIPTRPPTRTDDRRRLTGQSTTKVRRLTELAYPPSVIARILDVPPRAVEDFLRRLVPIRRAALSRPRSRAEQKRIGPPRPRCEPPPAPPEIPADEAWRYQDGPSPTDPPPATIAPAAAVLELHQVEVEAPPPAREPWDGPTSPFGGKPKLTEEEALEVRHKRAAGWSVYELADAYEVTRNTIYRSLRLTTDLPPLPCPDAGCPENGQ